MEQRRSPLVAEKSAANFWQDRPVFVTGCAGFLGSWVIKSLVASGASVVGLVRDNVPQSRLRQDGLIDKINVVSGDVEDQPLLERIVNEYEVDTVFHLAAQTIVTTANRSPLSTFETNIKGTWNLLEACRRVSSVQQVVIASSDKAYGHHDTLPYTEQTHLQGHHPYDVSKSCSDLIAHTYFQTYGTPVCITRFGNFYGGGDLNFNRVVPQTIRSVIRGTAPLIRSDGLNVRDYVYIEDAARAYITIAERMAWNRDLAGEAFNFSTDTPTTVLAVVEMILKLMDKEDLKPRVLNEATNEIREQHLDPSKAKALLDWHPRFSLNEGLDRTIEWYRRYLRDDI